MKLCHLFVLLLLALPSMAGNGISLSSGKLDTNALPHFTEYRGLTASNQKLYLVQFQGPVQAEQRQKLAQSARIVAYVPNNAFLVVPNQGRQRGNGLQAINNLPFVSWIGPYLPQYKTAPAVQSLAAQKPERGAGLVELSIEIVAGAGAALTYLDGAQWQSQMVDLVATKDFDMMRVRVPRAKLADYVAAMSQNPDVVWIERTTAKRLLNDDSVWVGQSGLNSGQTTPLFDRGVNGDGAVVAYLDTGLDADSCYFYDAAEGLPNGTPNNNQRKVIAYMDLGNQGNWDSQDHGTHVAGSIAGDNGGDGLHQGADGMAPAAKLIVQDGGYAPDDFADMPYLPTDYINSLFLPAYNMGARVHSNSWGAHENFGSNNYTQESRMCDQFMWDHKDFLILFAAGNDGHNGSPSIGDPATAKNVVAVAATQPGSSANSLASFSSNGPTQDGRLKPDISAPGQAIVSANNDGNINSFNCNTQSMSGTSMATPTAAGHVAQIWQYYNDGFYPTGAANSADGFAPSAALMKATLLLSGRAMTNEGTWPNTNQGWGRITLDDVLYFSGDDQTMFIDEHSGLQTGQNQEYALSVGEGDQLKVAVVWTDYPSTPAASTNLVNNLNLSVIGPGGTYLGNVFSGGYSTTGGTADGINNVEMVFLEAAQAGTYTLRVEGASVPQGPQPFAIVARTAVDPDAPTTLANDVPVSGLSGSSGSEVHYVADVPAGAASLQIVTSGGSGDCDLYVRYGAKPTTSTWDYRPYENGNNETVSVTNPTAGKWYVMLRGYSSYSGMTLRATWPNTQPTPPVASFSESVSGLSVSFTDTSSDADGTIVQRAWNFGDGATSAAANPSHTYASGGTYTVTLTVTDNDGSTDSTSKQVTVQETQNIPPTAGFTFSANNLSVSFTDTSSDSDGGITSRAWTFGDGGSSSAANPAHTYAAAGTYSVTLTVTDTDGATDQSTQSVTVTAPPDGDLSNGQTVTGISASSGQWEYFTVTVPEGASNLVMAISGGSGDADLYTRFGQQPTTSAYDCRPYKNGNAETCTVASPNAGTYHIGIRAYSNFSGLNLTVSWTEPGDSTGTTETNLGASSGNWLYYTIDVPAGQSRLDIDISGGSGDADLYVRYGSQPTTGSYDYRPYLNGNNESVSVTNPQAGTWHIGVRAYSTFSGVTLNAYFFP